MSEWSEFIDSMKTKPPQTYDELAEMLARLEKKAHQMGKERTARMAQACVLIAEISHILTVKELKLKSMFDDN